MEIVYLVVGVIVGGLLGYLWAARKSVSLRSELQMNQQHAQDLLKAEKERAELLTEQYRKDTERLRGQVDELSGKWGRGRSCTGYITGRASQPGRTVGESEGRSGEIAEATEYGV